MIHHASFLTTRLHHRGALVQRASTLTGERPRTVCAPRRALRALRREAPAGGRAVTAGTASAR